MIDAEKLLNGFIHRPVNFRPGNEYGPSKRKYQGIPAIERTPGGRLWAAWYAGPVWEDQHNYILTATSDDNGHTWSDIQFVIDPDGDGPKRAADPCLWLDPDGTLWLFWWLNGDGVNVTMAISTNNPDGDRPVWSPPKALFPGVMMNKPIVSKNGDWLMPSAIWFQENSCRVMSSPDKGKTWELRGSANVPEPLRNYDEPMMIERTDGSLWMLVRTKDGIGQTVSTDHGKTWPCVKNYMPQIPSRFFIGRLPSGNLLLIRHGEPDERTESRSCLTACLSDDDGASWKGGLLIDARKTVSYPDAAQAPDGTIYMIYDWNRSEEKQILMTAFSEEDVLSGKYISRAARPEVIINQADGINPRTWIKNHSSLLRSDHYAPAFRSGPPAKLSVEEPDRILPLQNGNRLFSDRDYTLPELPGVLQSGRHFVYSLFASVTKARCTDAGMVYAVVPSEDRTKERSAGLLTAQGFKKTSEEEFYRFPANGEKAFSSDICSIYQKKADEGEIIKSGEGAVLIW